MSSVTWKSVNFQKWRVSFHKNKIFWKTNIFSGRASPAFMIFFSMGFLNFWHKSRHPALKFKPWIFWVIHFWTDMQKNRFLHRCNRQYGSNTMELLPITPEMFATTSMSYLVSSGSDVVVPCIGLFGHPQAWPHREGQVVVNPSKLSYFLEKFYWDITASILLQWKCRNYRETIRAVA